MSFGFERMLAANRVRNALHDSLGTVGLQSDLRPRVARELVIVVGLI